MHRRTAITGALAAVATIGATRTTSGAQEMDAAELVYYGRLGAVGDIVALVTGEAAEMGLSAATATRGGAELERAAAEWQAVLGAVARVMEQATPPDSMKAIDGEIDAAVWLLGLGAARYGAVARTMDTNNAAQAQAEWADALGHLDTAGVLLGAFAAHVAG
jgi:hypothetical protein